MLKKDLFTSKSSPARRRPGRCLMGEQLGVLRRGKGEVGHAPLLASGDEGLRQVRNAKKNGEPSGVIQAGARILHQDSGGDVIQRGEAVDPVPMVLGETRSHPCTSVMTDDGGALVPMVVHQCREVVGHSALVVTRVRLLGLAVTAQIGSDDCVPLREHRYLLAPREPSLRKAV